MSEFSFSFPPGNKKVFRKKNTSATGELNGVNNTPKAEKISNLNVCPGEDVWFNGDSWIVLGRDRPAGCASGYGGAGDAGASAIDICVGRQNANRKKPVVTENNFGTISYNKKPGDAARIYISQRTDIDENFGLCQGEFGHSKAKAAIALYADDVRIIARRSVKIVTGGAKQTDANGLNTNSIMGVELIAGNIDHKDRKGRKYLQKMVKGGNLVELLEQIIDEINNLNGLLKQSTLNNINFTRSIVSAPLLVTTATGPGTAVFNPDTISAAMKKVNSDVSELMTALTTQRKIVTESMKRNYLIPNARLNILSKYHRLN